MNWEVLIAAISGGGVALIGSLVGPVLVGKMNERIQKRQQRYDAATPTPPTTQQVWDRLNHVEIVQRSIAYVAMRYINNWPTGHARPVLAKQHVAVLEKEGYDLNPTSDDEPTERE